MPFISDNIHKCFFGLPVPIIDIPYRPHTLYTILIKCEYVKSILVIIDIMKDQAHSRVYVILSESWNIKSLRGNHVRRVERQVPNNHSEDDR